MITRDVSYTEVNLETACCCEDFITLDCIENVTQDEWNVMKKALFEYRKLSGK